MIKGVAWPYSSPFTLHSSLKSIFLLLHDERNRSCLLYTSDAADERSSVDLGGRRIIKKKKKQIITQKKEESKSNKKTTRAKEQRRL